MPQMPLPARRGRPPKFGRPSQAVTITLPDDIVSSLRALDADLSRAIVRLAESSALTNVPRRAVELTHYGRSAVIVVLPRPVLKRLPGVSLIPLPDGRALISLDSESSAAEFEVLLRDALEGGAVAPADRPVMEGLGEILRSARQSRGVTLRQRNIIVLENKRAKQNGKAPHPAPRGGK